jgi:hypothetical protein
MHRWPFKFQQVSRGDSGRFIPYLLRDSLGPFSHMITNFDTNSAEYRERMQVVIDELQSESDRTVAIVGGAWVEEGLVGLLQAAFQPELADWKKIAGTFGSLSAFATKIDLAFLLRLVSRQVAKDLTTIREIRNDFAHNIVHKKTKDRLSFEEQGIRRKCLTLGCVEHLKLTDPRQAFIRACAVLNADFKSMQMFVQVPHLGTVMTHNEAR